MKTHLRALFEKFGVEDLPQNQKRVALAERALQSGLVSRARAVSETAAARLARFAVSTPAAKIGDAVLERAGLHLLDTVGCGLAAVGLDAGGSATRAAAARRGEPEAIVLAGSAAPAPVAALANGTRFHALDFDDTHERGICHVSAVLAAAALAAGQAGGRSGAETLAAYALGSEVTLRIAVAGAESIYGRGFHPTSAFGVFGATATAARLLGLPAETATRALGVAGSFAGGLLEFLSDGSDTKPLHAGWAAHAGICAAELAAAGAAGPASVLEGRFGVLAAFGGDAAPGDRHGRPRRAMGARAGGAEGVSDVPLVALRRRRAREADRRRARCRCRRRDRGDRPVRRRVAGP